MLYIHSLRDLNRKSADIESIPLIREIKKNNTYPLQAEKLKDQLSIYFASKTDIDSMIKAMELVPQAINGINEIADIKDFEHINLVRALSGLQELPVPLQNNIDYSQLLFSWQDAFIAELSSLLNSISSLKTDLEKRGFDQKLTDMFAKILRNKEDFVFDYSGVINEAQLARIRNLTDSMESGFFFRTSLEEQLRKSDVGDLSRRVPREHLEKVISIAQKMKDIKIGVERAYESNMRMVNLAVIIYSYIKWIRVI